MSQRTPATVTQKKRSSTCQLIDGFAHNEAVSFGRNQELGAASRIMELASNRRARTCNLINYVETPYRWDRSQTAAIDKSRLERSLSSMVFHQKDYNVGLTIFAW
jgi:hypothetical protein